MTENESVLLHESRAVVVRPFASSLSIDRESVLISCKMISKEGRQLCPIKLQSKLCGPSEPVPSRWRLALNGTFLGFSFIGPSDMLGCVTKTQTHHLIRFDHNISFNRNCCRSALGVCHKHGDFLESKLACSNISAQFVKISCLRHRPLMQLYVFHQNVSYRLTSEVDCPLRHSRRDIDSSPDRQSKLQVNRDWLSRGHRW